MPSIPCLRVLSTHRVTSTHSSFCCVQNRRLEVAAAADKRAEQVRAAHQAKLARAEQQAALAQQRKVEQAAELKKRSQLVAARNQEIHQKRCASDTSSRTN